jgi:hypothetical protein
MKHKKLRRLLKTRTSTGKWLKRHKPKTRTQASKSGRITVSDLFALSVFFGFCALCAWAAFNLLPE